jgi:Xaa-Pro aminopeptidase
MMTADELMWLDGYHAEVRRRVGPHVSGAALAWLTERTQPIG